MSKITLLRAKELRSTAAVENSSTSLACLRRGFDSQIAAFTRAILGISVNRPTTIEHLAAIRTSARTTSITDLCPSRTRQELLVALGTRGNRRTIRKATALYQFRVIAPELNFCRTMTSRTERYQIFQTIRFAILIEKVKRRHVVNGQSRSLFAAMLASILVPFANSGTLLVPVRTTITSMSSKPGRIIHARPRFRSAPLGKAIPSAKVVFADCAWMLLKDLATDITGHFHPFASNANTVDSLPLGIAGKPTKRTLGERHMIPTALYWLAALCACNFNHADIKPHIVYTVNGGHLA